MAIQHPDVASAVFNQTVDFFGERLDGLVIETEHSKLGTLREVRSPIRFSSGETTVRRAAPALAEHTQERLLKAGFTEEEIAGWTDARLV